MAHKIALSQSWKSCAQKWKVWGLKIWLCTQVWVKKQESDEHKEEGDVNGTVVVVVEAQEQVLLWKQEPSACSLMNTKKLHKMVLQTKQLM